MKKDELNDAELNYLKAITDSPNCTIHPYKPPVGETCYRVRSADNSPIINIPDRVILKLQRLGHLKIMDNSNFLQQTNKAQ